MQVRRISGLCLVASLLAVLPACVIHSGGETFAFGGDDYKAERQETFALELAAGETLDVELPYGDILVRVANGEAPHVAAHWHAGGDDQAMAEAVLARYKLELTRGQAQLSVRAVGEPVAAKGTFSMKRYGASVDLVLVVPPGVKLSAVSSSGELSATGALGACQLKSSYGDVSASGVRGETLLQTASGKATVAEIEGPSIRVTSQYGDVSARALQAATVELSSSSGAVSAEHVRGTLRLNSGYGSLSVRSCPILNTTW